jgi:hypothetical protein
MRKASAPMRGIFSRSFEMREGMDMAISLQPYPSSLLSHRERREEVGIR